MCSSRSSKTLSRFATVRSYRTFLDYVSPIVQGPDWGLSGTGFLRAQTSVQILRARVDAGVGSYV